MGSLRVLQEGVMADLERINAIAELDRLEVKWAWSGENEVRVLCPFHEDSNPSLCLNVQSKVFKCHVGSCNAHGDVVDLVASVEGTTRSVAYVALAKRYGIPLSKPIEITVVERWHSSIFGAIPLLQALTARGVDDSVIRKYRLGEEQGRITIPIKDESGYYVDAMKYLPGAPGPQKMRHQKGRGKERLYPIEQLTYDTLLLVGGPIKAIASANVLNAKQIGAVTSTAGEQTIAADLLPYFKNKTVYICMDIDNAGQAAALALAKQLSGIAARVYVVKLPLDAKQYPKGDVNDFIGGKHGDLHAVLESTEEWVPPVEVEEVETPAIDMSLTTAMTATSAYSHLRVKAVIAAASETPYTIPKTVEVNCDRSLKECAACAIFKLPPSPLVDIQPRSPALLEMVNANTVTLRSALQRALKIPQSCRVCDLQPKLFFSAEDVRLSPQLDITAGSAERMMQPAVVLSDSLELNEPYSLSGYMYPHPQTQQSTLLIYDATPTQDALSSYQLDNAQRLTFFNPSAWTLDALESRFNEMTRDFEANVTRILQRQDLHLLVGLTYHSPLFMTFDDRVVKGWLDTLIIGDSAQGKTETTLHLSKHYDLGEKVECKNATVPGLLGGLQQLGNKWYVTWGVIPTNDGRLVILEEVKGASQEVIGKLTDMRSSGIAEIPKIERRKTHARTRLIWLSNPRGPGKVSSYSFGIETIKELMGGLEDVRRFDAALVLSSDEVSSSVLNKLQSERFTLPHTHTKDLCRGLILWSWTRKPDQVQFSQDATETILLHATKLCDTFTDAMPLLDRGSSRYKLARIAAAAAAMSFSASLDFEQLQVRKCHADFAFMYLMRIYSKPQAGYLEYTAAINHTTVMSDEPLVEQKIKALPYPRDFVSQILRANKLDVNDIQDWCGWDRVAAQELLSFFVRKHAVQRDGKAYRKTAPFIVMLRKLGEGSLPEATERDSKADF